MRAGLITLGLMGLLVICGTILSYVIVGGFSLTLSTNPADWANFGTFVGGVAGPLLSFLALIAVAWTLRLQYELLQRDRERQMAEQHVRWLGEVYRDIQDVLQSSVADGPDSPLVTLGEILSTGSDLKLTKGSVLEARLLELLKLLFQYCEAVALYRENVTKFFDLRIFVDRGARLLDQLKRVRSLVRAEPFMIEFCDMHLRGDAKRINAEALKRPTRE